jgi:hypothetical protein
VFIHLGPTPVCPDRVGFSPLIAIVKAHPVLLGGKGWIQRAAPVKNFQNSIRQSFLGGRAGSIDARLHTKNFGKIKKTN